MWLLNTARAELKYFPTPESVPGGYAILSHVWDQHEESFQDIQALCARCATDGTNPRDLASDKIRNFCILAERAGYEWGWDDTCCIDKTSSTELSEAINSMYRYYSLAEICYAYLGDVPTAGQDALSAPESEFRKSRWHRRGWTLQELIAPPLVVLLSKTWEPLGAKADLAPTLAEITRVPVAVLRFEVGPTSYCVAARMSWAANRVTTRPEDEAYCLMGIFGIFMPPLYGEGRNAFLRLQEEIMKQVEDSSIFAWGRMYDRCDWKAVLTAASGWSESELGHDHLFARSPSDFHIGHAMGRRASYHARSRPTLWERLSRLSPDLSNVPTFNITSYGVVAHLPVLRPSHKDQKRFLIAFLFGAEKTVGLLLDETEAPDPTRELYTPCFRKPESDRLLLLDQDPLEIAAHLKGTFEWKTIHIVHRPTTESQGLRMVSRSLLAPFHIPRWHIAELLRNPDVVSSSLHGTHAESPPRPDGMSLEFEVSPPGSGVRFKLVIHLGLCSCVHEGDPKHWALVMAQGDSSSVSTLEPKHICAKHHVDEWRNQTHAFAISSHSRGQSVQLRVELSFGPCARDPTLVREVHFDFAAIPKPNPKNISKEMMRAPRAKDNGGFGPRKL